MKFRKKPVVIDAWEIGSCDPKKAPKWVIDAFAQGVVSWRPFGPGLEIMTLEGKMTANMGDMLIRGVKGELYACRCDIFAATYEAAE